MSKAEDRPRVVLVIRCIILNDENKLLLIQRAQNDRWAPGTWEVPGGKLDLGQDLSQALEREVFEETGLTIKPIHPLMCAHSETISNGPYQGFPYVCLFGVGQFTGGDLTLGSEHSKAAWVTYRQALRYKLKPEIRAALHVFKRYQISV